MAGFFIWHHICIKKSIIFTLLIQHMKKKYFYYFILVFTFLSFHVSAQDVKQNVVSKSQEPTIEGLTIYPNPTNSGKIYVTSKNASEKKIEVFDVLGKKVLETLTASKEISVSNLSPGVYIIKVREGEASATRKLIVN